MKTRKKWARILIGIYQIVHVESGKKYIGSSKNIKARWRQHKSALRRGKKTNPRLQNAWNKYGESSFVFEVVEECDIDILIEREKHYISTLDPAYNIQLDPTNPTFNLPSEEGKLRARKKRSQNLKYLHEQNIINSKKPVNRVDLITGEIVEYPSATAAETDGFMSRSITACCRGEKATHRSYAWEFSDGSSREFEGNYIKAFKPVVGMKDGVGWVFNSYEEVADAGFNYGKIRLCCQGVRGRRFHNGYEWFFENESIQSAAEQKRHRSFAETFNKAVIGTNITTGEVRKYASQAEAKKDGFDQRKISACCCGKRMTHKGYSWKFVNSDI